MEQIDTGLAFPNGVAVDAGHVLEATGNAGVTHELIGDLHGGGEKPVARGAVGIVVILNGRDDFFGGLVAREKMGAFPVARDICEAVKGEDSARVGQKCSVNMS